METEKFGKLKKVRIKLERGWIHEKTAEIAETTGNNLKYGKGMKFVKKN